MVRAGSSVKKFLSPTWHIYRPKVLDREVFQVSSVFACSIIEMASLHLVRTTSKAQGVRIIEEDGPLDIWEMDARLDQNRRISRNYRWTTETGGLPTQMTKKSTIFTHVQYMEVRRLFEQNYCSEIQSAVDQPVTKTLRANKNPWMNSIVAGALQSQNLSQRSTKNKQRLSTQYRYEENLTGQPTCVSTKIWPRRTSWMVVEKHR